MKQYLELVAHVIKNGTKQANRTGVNTISFPGAMLRYDLKEGFPAITTRKPSRLRSRGSVRLANSM